MLAGHAGVYEACYRGLNSMQGASQLRLLLVEDVQRTQMLQALDIRIAIGICGQLCA